MKKEFLFIISTLFTLASNLAQTANDPWKDESCSFIKKDLTLSPEKLVIEYIERDLKGDFSDDDNWFNSAVVCPGHEPGPDSTTVVKGYKIVKKTKDEFTIEFDVFGTADSNGYYPSAKKETVKFKVLKTPYGFKLSNGYPGGNQFESPVAAAKILPKDGKTFPGQKEFQSLLKK